MCNTHSVSQEQQPQDLLPGDVCTCAVEGVEEGNVCAGCHSQAFRDKIKDEDVYVGQECARTRLLERLDSGSFGEVYLGSKLDTDEQVAVKVERPGATPRQLLYEGSVYRVLAGGPGIPCMYWYGLLGSAHNALVMQLLGPNLQNLFKKCGERLSLSTTLQIIDQMITTIQYIHASKFVHRDLSPNNFMIGLGENSSRIYLIDFGQSKKSSTGPNFLPGRRHFPVARSLVGTPRFASLHAHMGRECASRDDLESLTYVWIYFMKGRLPWQGLRHENQQEKMAAIFDIKQKLSPVALCEGLPDEFSMFLAFIRKLKQYDIPDYDSIKKLFQTLAAKEGVKYDGVFDWDMLGKMKANSKDGVCEKTKGNAARESKVSSSSNESIVSH